MTFTTGQIIAFIVGLFGLILTMLNIIDKLTALRAKSETPFKNLATKVEEHDRRITTLENAQFDNLDRAKEQEETNEILLKSLLALIEFEITFMLQEGKPISKDLEKAKEDLHSFLSKR